LLSLPESDEFAMDQDGAEDGTFKGWSACAQAMRTYDEQLVQGWKEELDTLLLLVSVLPIFAVAGTDDDYSLVCSPPF
jgi:hypothetical protein